MHGEVADPAERAHRDTGVEGVGGDGELVVLAEGQVVEALGEEVVDAALQVAADPLAQLEEHLVGRLRAEPLGEPHGVLRQVVDELLVLLGGVPEDLREEFADGVLVDRVAGRVGGQGLGEVLAGLVRDLAVDELTQPVPEEVAHVLGELLGLRQLLGGPVGQVLPGGLERAVRTLLGHALERAVRALLGDALEAAVHQALLAAAGQVLDQVLAEVAAQPLVEALHGVVQHVLEPGARQALEVVLESAADPLAEYLPEELAEAEAEQLQRTREQAVDRPELQGLEGGLAVPVVLVVLGDLDGLDDHVEEEAADDAQELVHEQLPQQPEEDLLDDLGGGQLEERDLRERGAEGDRPHRDGPGDLGGQLHQLGDRHPLGVLDLVGRVVRVVAQLGGGRAGHPEVVVTAGPADQLPHRVDERVGRLALELGQADVHHLDDVGLELRNVLRDDQIVIAGRAQLVLVGLGPRHAGQHLEEPGEPVRDHDRHVVLSSWRSVRTGEDQSV